MKKKELNEFPMLLKQLFKYLSQNVLNLKLNGSFKTSYFASDIDLYERVTKRSLRKLQTFIRYMPKHHKNKPFFNIIEVKVVNQKDEKIKYHDVDDIENIVLPTNISFVKIDLIIYFLEFPMEVTIIYDFDSQKKLSKKEIIERLLEDIQDPDINMFKAVKRFNSIGKLFGKPDLLKDFTENTQLGVLYLCKTRLEILKQIKHLIDSEEYSRLLQIVQNDLRVYKVKISDDIDKKINDIVKSFF